MGGDTDSVQSSIIADDDDDHLFTTIPEFPLLSGETPAFRPGRSFRDHHKTSEIEANEKRKNSVYAQVIKSYDNLKDRVENLEMAKCKVLSYSPGSWVKNIGGITRNVPKTTTLLIIGPKGSGKSSLINRISRVFEDDKFAPERAQVAYNSSIFGGTRFLQEYMIPRNSSSFCLYDTRGFSDSLFENSEMINQWMINGVRHGELVDSSSFWAQMNYETHQDRRRVDFVIFVVNGLSVLKCMENSGTDTFYMHTLTEAFNSPFLSFKDHKPVIAITHGDLLSISERARVRVYLGNTLGVHPSKQIFDIPDDCEPTTDVAIVDLVCYALEHADRNFPCKPKSSISKEFILMTIAQLLLVLAVAILMFTVYFHGFNATKLHPESVIKPDMGIKNVTEIDPGIVHENMLVTKNVTEIDPGIASEYFMKLKKFIPESIRKIKKMKKDKAERITRKKQRMKKARVAEREQVVDWKTIRHLWYA